MVILLILYFGNIMVDNLIQEKAILEDKILRYGAKIENIALKLNIIEKENIDFYKVQKNKDVFKNTSCLECHSSIDTALPIFKISIDEAIDIVRMAMSSFSTDGLRKRLNLLYTDELLEYAKELNE